MTFIMNSHFPQIMFRGTLYFSMNNNTTEIFKNVMEKSCVLLKYSVVFDIHLLPKK